MLEGFAELIMAVITLALQVWYWIAVGFYKAVHYQALAILKEPGVKIAKKIVMRCVLAVFVLLLLIVCRDYETGYRIGQSIFLVVSVAVVAFYLIGKFLSRHKLPEITAGSKQRDGHAYEHKVARALSARGYHNVKVTPGSGDFGADIIASKGFTKYAIQCKCYSGAVGVSAVQEAISGKAYYGCNRAMVVTNATFTPAAKKMAKKADVVLWERFSPSGMDWIDRVTELDAILED